MHKESCCTATGAHVVVVVENVKERKKKKQREKEQREEQEILKLESSRVAGGVGSGGEKAKIKRLP